MIGWSKIEIQDQGPPTVRKRAASSTGQAAASKKAHKEKTWIVKKIIGDMPH